MGYTCILNIRHGPKLLLDAQIVSLFFLIVLRAATITTASIDISLAPIALPIPLLQSTQRSLRYGQRSKTYFLIQRRSVSPGRTFVFDSFLEMANFGLFDGGGGGFGFASVMMILVRVGVTVVLGDTLFLFVLCHDSA